ncbi:MAG: SDR family oxidoreductase [Candidatus Omnitrophica bacterium]|nr:SDR family oxidoreductase [Candidatus Omnitrophota bacterium]
MRILIVGATSAIAQKVARLFAKANHSIFLAARNEKKLVSVAQDIQIHGAHPVHYMTLDMNDFDLHPALIHQATQSLGGLDILLVAHGQLPDQPACQVNVREAEQAFKVNFLSVLSLLTHASHQFQKQGSGTIAVISSVAGDRGRQSNYIYGSAKGALNIFLEGLRNRLFPYGVHVLTIKPGYVDTPMTSHLKKNRLFADPESVARDIYKAIQKKKDVVYTPWFWRYILLGIKLCPEWIFKRTKL